MNEIELLDDARQRTRDELRSAMVEFGRDVQRVANLPTLVRRHPVVMLGGGVAAGFVVGKMLRMNPVTRRKYLGPRVRPLWLATRTAILGAFLNDPE